MFYIYRMFFINVPPNTCRVYFNSYSGTYSTYFSGWHWVGFSGFFMTPISTLIQEKFTKNIPLTTYHDYIEKYLILTASKLPVFIDCSAHICVSDPHKAVTTSNDIDSMVDSICKSELRNTFSTLDLDQIVTTQSNLQKRLLSSINEDLRSYGISCVGFTLTRVKLPQIIQNSVTKITSEQLQQRCAIIEAQTNQKVHLKNLQLRQQTHKANLAMAQLDDLELIRRVQEYKKIDPQFSLNNYLNHRFRSKAYSKCNSIALYEGPVYTPTVPIQSDKHCQ